MAGVRVRSASAGTLESREWNFVVDLPPDWTEETPKPAWEKDGIRKGAKVGRLGRERRIDADLKDGRFAFATHRATHQTIL